MSPEGIDPKRLLLLIGERGIEGIVLGNAGALLQGAPIVTHDVDIVHRRTTDNIAKLLLLLRDVGAYYRTRTDRRFVPEESHLRSPGHQLLATSYGQLDLLGTVNGLGYDELLPDSLELDLGPCRIRVLDLARIIELKQVAGREKDRMVLPILKRTLELRDKDRHGC